VQRRKAKLRINGSGRDDQPVSDCAAGIIEDILNKTGFVSIERTVLPEQDGHE